MKLIKTGIAGLDEFLQGGLPPKVILLSGLPGSGNEVFVRQTAYTRAKQTGVTYFTVKSDPEFVKEEMSSHGWNVTPLEKKGMWKFYSQIWRHPISRPCGDSATAWDLSQKSVRLAGRASFLLPWWPLAVIWE